MHGVMAAELIGPGFTANEDIIDGDDGVMRMMGLEVGDPEKVLDGPRRRGTWPTRGSTMRLHASCGAGHWARTRLQQIVQARPFSPERSTRSSSTSRRS